MTLKKINLSENILVVSEGNGWMQGLAAKGRGGILGHDKTVLYLACGGYMSICSSKHTELYYQKSEFYSI